MRERTRNMAKLRGSRQAGQRAVAIRTLGDLGEQSQLYAYCDACRHSSQLDLAALRERCGPKLSFKSLRARLRCSRCGARSTRDFPCLGCRPARPSLSLPRERRPGAHELASDQFHLAELRLGIELPFQLGDPIGPMHDIGCGGWFDGHGAGYVATGTRARKRAQSSQTYRAAARCWPSGLCTAPDLLQPLGTRTKRTTAEDVVKRCARFLFPQNRNNKVLASLVSG